MIGYQFLLIDKVDGVDAIVGEGLVAALVAPGHYQCEFHGPGPAYTRILSVSGMTRLVMFPTRDQLKRFKAKCFPPKVDNDPPQE